LNDREGTSSPDFPEGGVSRIHYWDLQRPAGDTEGDLDAWGEGGEVATELGMRAGVGLVVVAMASRWVEGKEGQGRRKGCHPVLRLHRFRFFLCL
jgi:hypothetical protein